MTPDEPIIRLAQPGEAHTDVDKATFFDAEDPRGILREPTPQAETVVFLCGAIRDLILRQLPFYRRHRNVYRDQTPSAEYWDHVIGTLKTMTETCSELRTHVHSQPDMIHPPVSDVPVGSTG